MDLLAFLRVVCTCARVDDDSGGAGSIVRQTHDCPVSSYTHPTRPSIQIRYPWNPPHVGSTYALEQLPEAVRALQSGQTVGKVVVQVDAFEAGE